MRGQDLTKTLDAAEVIRLRALLQERPDLGEILETGDYPKILYHQKFYAAQQEWRTSTDPSAKQRLAEVMKLASHKVFDSEEEEDYLADGWKANPADHLEEKDDPRIPRGLEARRALKATKVDRQQEVLALRRRLAELTGEVEPPTQMAAPAKVAKRRKGPDPDPASIDG
jgi:hypothetical protein